MTPYDIQVAFEKIETSLLESITEDLKKGIKQEDLWQTDQLRRLRDYRIKNAEKYGPEFAKLNAEIEMLLGTTEESARTTTLELIQETGADPVASIEEVKMLNARKLDALIDEVHTDFVKAESAALRATDDAYRRIIFNAAVSYNTGSGTLAKCIDMASKEYLEGGIKCVTYKNGRQVGLGSYSEMALRTANKRAYLTGEGNARDEYGLSLVVITKRGSACPLCAPFCGKVCIDDVYSRGRPDGEHPLLSEFMAAGLYHPNCKDSHTTYFPGISAKPKPMTAAEQQEAVQIYNEEQVQRYNERQIRKYGRLTAGSLDKNDKEHYGRLLEKWKGIQKDYLAEHPLLKRTNWREDYNILK